MSSAAPLILSGFPSADDLHASPLPQRDHRISLDDAAQLTRAHRHNPILLERPLAFRREAFEQLLAQPGCTGIRLYPAQHDDERATLVMVGVDAVGNDLTTGLLMQWPLTCPEVCSDENPLNMD